MRVVSHRCVDTANFVDECGFIAGKRVDEICRRSSSSIAAYQSALVKGADIARKEWQVGKDEQGKG
jgi:hypothetical protein